MNNKPAQKRIAALVFLACFLIVSILSSACILTHANHEHDHNGFDGSCATCARLQSAENILKQFGSALAGALFAIAGLFAAIGTLNEIVAYLTLSSPVTLKIRMNN